VDVHNISLIVITFSYALCRFLMYEYMQNGSLKDHLHSEFAVFISVIPKVLYLKDIILLLWF